jgi:tRNA-specific 2-thiouridylase
MSNHPPVTRRAAVVVGDDGDLVDGVLRVADVVWAAGPVEADVLVQVSAHGAAHAARCTVQADGTIELRWADPRRRVAPGQSVVVYDTTDEIVLGGGIARR